MTWSHAEERRTVRAKAVNDFLVSVKHGKYKPKETKRIIAEKHGISVRTLYRALKKPVTESDRE